MRKRARAPAAARAVVESGYQRGRGLRRGAFARRPRGRDASKEGPNALCLPRAEEKRATAFLAHLVGTPPRTCSRGNGHHRVPPVLRGHEQQSERHQYLHASDARLETACSAATTAGWRTILAGWDFAKVRNRSSARTRPRAAAEPAEPAHPALGLELSQDFLEQDAVERRAPGSRRPENPEPSAAAPNPPPLSPPPPPAERVVSARLFLSLNVPPVHLLERLLRARSGVLIRVELERELTVRLLELGVARALGDAEEGVVIFLALDAADKLKLRGGRVASARVRVVRLGLTRRRRRARGRGRGARRRRAARGRGRSRARSLNLLRERDEVILRGWGAGGGEREGGGGLGRRRVESARVARVDDVAADARGAGIGFAAKRRGQAAAMVARDSGAEGKGTGAARDAPSRSTWRCPPRPP